MGSSAEEDRLVAAEEGDEACERAHIAETHGEFSWACVWSEVK